ncbi:hypothetical protein Tcan_13783 [Toxocara canis]|uniref:Uncharacterized protein n=1 Tax=Toxocara canis TaxID=6265 RepID=A0A0B2VVA3_TOXCA|nr:hypothetical protein Tcan_13783 [Toxocara canis]
MHLCWRLMLRFACGVGMMTFLAQFRGVPSGAERDDCETVGAGDLMQDHGQRRRIDVGCLQRMHDPCAIVTAYREGEDDLKRKQLTELAILNGTYRPVKQQILILVRCLHAIFISPLGSPITQASSVPTANSFVQFHLSSGKSDHTGEQCTYGELFRAVTQHRLQCANEPFVFGCCSPDIFVDGEWRLPAIVVKVPGGHLAHQRCSSVKGAAVISSRSDPHYATGVYWLGLTLEAIVAATMIPQVKVEIMHHDNHAMRLSTGQHDPPREHDNTWIERNAKDDSRTPSFTSKDALSYQERHATLFPA